VVARYDYDPYGRSTTVLGTTPTDFNFTGLYRHSKSNLDLAVYRAYDPDLGRWLNRDPLKNVELRQGPNMFAYVKNRPVNLIDLLGLQDTTPTPQPGTHPTPSSPPEGINLSAAGQALLAGMAAGVGPVVPGSELLDAAGLAADIGKAHVLQAFDEACVKCAAEALCHPDVKCDVCDDFQLLQERFKNEN
jgi:RHS repeat-associated protein